MDKLKKKVLLFSSNFPEYTIELANNLIDFCQVTLLFPENRITQKHISLIRTGVIFKQYRLVDYKSIRDNFIMLWSIAKIILKYNPDIIHLQSYGLKNFWLLTPFIFRKKLVNTIHDPTPHTGDTISKPNYWNNKVINAFTNSIIVHGEILKGEVVDHHHVSKNKIFVVPHGHFKIYENWRINTHKKEECTFLFFGRIWKYKGLNYFIEAANIICKEFPAARFIIAGKGEEITPYLEKIEHPQNFEIRNYRISEAEIDELFQKSTYAVLPYTDATQSGVIPIALVYESIIIASNVGAISEVIIDNINGILVESKNSSKLAQKMTLLIKNDNLKNKLKSGGKKTAMDLLDWSNVARITSEIYIK